MLAVEEAQRRIWSRFTPAPLEWVGLDAALGRILAADLAARRDQPPAAVSAMDGYAVRAAETVDSARQLRIVAELPAGRMPSAALQPGEAARIFTGAILPEGANAILIQENAAALDGWVRAREPAAAGAFIRPRALDFAAGWIGLRTGRQLDPLALGLAAAMGHHMLPVRRQARIGLLATGDELRRPGETPGPAEIIASNGTLLAAFIRLWGGIPVDLGIAADTPAALSAALDQATGLDLLVTSGGASVGEYDLVRSALGRHGLELDFWKLAMRPGKPLVFGRLGPMPVVGLPGNPVSAAVCAIVFLRGILRSHAGLDPSLPIRDTPLAGDLPANDQRQDYLRARAERGPGGVTLVRAAPRQDSSMLATMSAADALVIRPPHAPALAAGALAPTLHLSDVFCGVS